MDGISIAVNINGILYSCSEGLSSLVNNDIVTMQLSQIGGLANRRSTDRDRSSNVARRLGDYMCLILMLTQVPLLI